MKGSGDFSIGSKVWSGTSKLIEEIGEVQEVFGKLQQTLGKLLQVSGDAENHWSGNLREKLVEEIGDVLAATTFFRKKNMTINEGIRIDERYGLKLALFEKWHAEQPTVPKASPVSVSGLVRGDASKSPPWSSQDMDIFRAAVFARCDPFWSDGILGWAWHCGCPDAKHGTDQQCSAMTLESIAQANKNPDPAVGDEP